MAAPSLLYAIPRPQELGQLLERFGFTLLVDHEVQVAGERLVASHPHERLVVGFGRAHRAAPWHGVAFLRIPTGEVLYRVPLYDHHTVAEQPDLATLPDVEAWLLGVVG